MREEPQGVASGGDVSSRFHSRWKETDGLRTVGGGGGGSSYDNEPTDYNYIEDL